MKIRLGFITNSSSSSFLVAFKKVPTTVEEMHDLLFGGEVRPLESRYVESQRYTTMDAAAKILADLQEVKPLDVIGVQEWVSGYCQDWDIPDDWDTEDCTEASKELFRQIAENIKAEARAHSSQFLADTAGSTFYALTYGDETDGELGQVCEVYAFDRVPNLNIGLR